VVVIFHDHGTRYLGKMYNDEWMRAILEVTGMTARDLVAMGVSGELCALHAGRAALDDDHVGESGGAHSRLQDR
jgi:cystathionine beta-synthase